jgi:hypothetical protein
MGTPLTAESRLPFEDSDDLDPCAEPTGLVDPVAPDDAAWMVVTDPLAVRYGLACLTSASSVRRTDPVSTSSLHIKPTFHVLEQAVHALILTEGHPEILDISGCKRRVARDDLG